MRPTLDRPVVGATLLSILIAAGCAAPPNEVGSHVAALTDADRLAIAQDTINAAPGDYGVCAGCSAVASDLIVDPLGGWHVAIQQSYSKVPIELRLTAHFDEKGAAWWPKAMMPRPKLATPATVTPAIAAKTAAATAFPKAASPTTRLIFWPLWSSDHTIVKGLTLAWDIGESADGADAALVDATTGALIRRYTRAHAVAVHRGRTGYSGDVALNVMSALVGWVLCDNTKGFTSGLCAYFGSDDSGLLPDLAAITDADDVWGTNVPLPWNATSGFQSEDAKTSAADAMWGIHNVWTMLHQVVGYSTAGQTPPKVVMFPPSTSCDNVLTFPISRVITVLRPCQGHLPPVTPDIIAHEYGHLIYPLASTACSAGESGGTCEAFGDIIGAMASFYLYGAGINTLATTIPSSGGSWEHGVQTGHLPRHVDHPSLDGVNVDYATGVHDDVTDPHFMTGPPSRAFYFLAAGAPATGPLASYLLPNGMTGLGNTDALKLLWLARAFLETGDYLDFRYAMLAAGERLDPYGYCRTMSQAIRDAFGAVGVGPIFDRIPPTVTLDVNLTSTSVNVWIDIDDGPTDINYSARVSLDGNLIAQTLSAPPYVPLMPLSSLSQGTHTIKLEVSDGGCNTVSKSRSFVVDTQPPVVTSVVRSGPVYAPTYAVALTDVSPVRVELLLGSTVLATDTTAPYAVGVNLLGWPTGSYNLVVRATDAVGLSTLVPVAVFADSTPPTILSFSPTQGFSPFPLLVDAVDVGEIASVTFNLDGVQLAADLLPPYSTVYTPTDGSAHTLTAIVTDSFLNTTRATISAPRDTIGPTITLGFEETPTVRSPITINDPCGVALPAHLYLDNLEVATISSTGYNHVWNGLAAGHHTLSVVANDNCGNSSRFDLPVDYMNQPPVIGSTTTNNANPKRPVVTIVATDDQSVANIKIRRGSTLLATLSAAPYVYTFDTTTWSDGLYDITIIATDNLNLTSQRTIQVRADNTPPVITSLSCARTSTTVTHAVARVAETGSGVASVHFALINSAAQRLDTTTSTTTGIPGEYAVNMGILVGAACGVEATDAFGNLSMNYFANVQ